MSALTKAQLGEITDRDPPTEVPGTLVDVQFNPTTLRLQISNKTAGGQQSGAQARQRPGTGEMQVSFDLVFDSADEGSTEAGVSVLDKTQMVERFVRPRGNTPGKEAPPRVIFKWGSFIVQGTMESANIDLDLFDAAGVPLRAKVAVTIKGQDPRWTYTPAPSSPRPGPGASGSSGSRPGSGSALPAGTPGTLGNSQAVDRVVQAMPGESLAQLAARVGFDPSAWRALANGLTNPLQLSLGIEVSLPAGAGQGVASGGSAPGVDPAKTAASLPLVGAAQATRAGLGSSDAARNARDGVTDPVHKGQAVTRQGGLAGVIASTTGAAHQEGASASLNAFGLARSVTANTDARPWGAGVPLRPRFGAAQSGGHSDPTQPGWFVQPASPPVASAGSRVATVKRSSANRPLGCGCRSRRGR